MLEYNGDMIWLVKKGKQKEDIEEMSRVFLGKVSRYLKYELYAYYTKELRLEEAAQRYRMLKEVSRQYFRKGRGFIMGIRGRQYNGRGIVRKRQERCGE